MALVGQDLPGLGSAATTAPGFIFKKPLGAAGRPQGLAASPALGVLSPPARALGDQIKGSICLKSALSRGPWWVVGAGMP